jgi:TP901 family phage tail tape measure protein
MADINLNIGGNTSQLMRDIEKTVNRVYSINLKTKGEQPLGRITGKVNEFNKSLDASNARVIAFGASAGLIFGVQRAFAELATATIEVQKSLQDINVILNVSTSQLQKFGGELFNIAKNTGQSFNAVAEAATEFSRQGLGVEETLKRTSEALILARLSGLDTVKSVEALTAAVNSFASQAVTATEIVNKFATVDAAFAVSSADLANAISRVGSSAAQSGVSLNELIAIVTSAQQTTARGGAVIGNSFKTIFTRLQRTKVVSLLESLGVETVGADGQLRSTIDLLQDLGKVYDTLGTQQQAYVAEQVGGVFQINILKAALADLGKEYSIYNSALDVAAGATDQAIKRNEELNKTYAAQLNALKENARQAGATVGARLFGPVFDRTVGNANELLGGINESDGQGVGAVLGKGILDGLGQVLAGPGLVLIGGVLFKLFKDLAGFATQSFQQLLGLNNASTQQRDLQQSINQILQKNPQLLELALKGEQGLANAANILLQNLRAQTAELQKQSTISAQIAKTFYASGVRVSSGVPTVPVAGKLGRTGKATGYIPNFSSDKLIEKYTAMSLGATSSVKPHLSQGTIGGKKFVMNNQEIEFPGVGKNGDSMVIPLYGDGPQMAAKGFIPNFAKTEKFTNFGGKYAYLVPYGVSEGILPSQKIGKYKVGGIPIKSPSKEKIDADANRDSINLYKNIEKSVVEEAFKYTNTIRPLNKGVTLDSIRSRFETTAGAGGALKGAAGAAFEVGIISALDYQSASRRGDKAGNFDIRGGANLKNIQDLFNLNPTVGLADFKVNADPGNIKKFYEKVRKEEAVGAFDPNEQQRNINRDAEIEVARDLEKNPELKKWVVGNREISRKAPDFIRKMVEDRKNIIRPRYNLSGFSKGPMAASGFIPNFAGALQDAISREKSAGIPKNQIYLAQDEALKSVNPMGIGVFNKRDEPTPNSRSEAIKKRGYARGYVPNFAVGNTETPTSDIVSALSIQLGSILPLLALTAQRGDDYAQSLQKITQANQEAGKVTNNLSKAQKNYIIQQAKAGQITGQEASKQIAIAQKYGATLTQAAQARLGGGGNAAFAAATVAPILAETLKQGIDQTTKEGRRNAAITSGLGQTAAFAATGFAVGGPVGAAVGAVAGAGLTLKSVLDEINTDLPELSTAAQQASEALTKFNDTSQKIITGFEQIKELREGGQRQKAGELEAQLLRNISVDFAESPDLALKATTAVLNKDFKSLTDALNANSEILIKQQQEKSRQESITKNIETLNKEGVNNKIGKDAAKALGLDFFRNVDVTQGRVETGNIDTLVKEFQKYQRFTTQVTNVPAGPIVPGGAPMGPIITAERVTKEDLIESIRASGLDEASQGILEKLIKEQDSIEGAIAALEAYKKNIENANQVQASVANQTAQNNKVIKLIQEALSKVASNFNKLASLSSETLAIQSVFNQAKQEALSAIQVEDLSGRAELAETFGGQEQSRKLGIRAERTKIGSEFDKDVASSLANVTDLIGQTLNQAIGQGLKEIGSFGAGTEEEKAKQQLSEAQRLSEAISSENIAKEVAGIVNAEEFKTGAGLLDTNAIVEALQQSQNFTKLNPEDQTKALDQVRQEINKSNQILQKSIVLQQQQLTILANQKLNQIIKELATAVINSFGGIEKFITGKALDDTIADDIKEILAERAGFRNTEGTPSRETETEYGRRAGRLLDAFTEVIGGRGGIFTENTGLVQEEIRGQANNIEDIYNAIRNAAMAPGSSTAEQEAFEKTRQALIEQSGVNAGPGGDMRPVFEEIARTQSLERRKSGEISTGIRDNAVKKLAELDPKLAELLKFDKEGNLISGGALDSADLGLSLQSQQVDLLTQIKEILSTAGSEVEFQSLVDSIAGLPINPANETFEEVSQLRDVILDNVSAVKDLSTNLNTLTERLAQTNVEGGSNQNLSGGTLGDITVSPAAISLTVEGSIGQDKIAEIEKVLREQSEQNISQVIAELNQKVARLEELSNNITAQNPGVRLPPRGVR